MRDASVSVWDNPLGLKLVSITLRSSVSTSNRTHFTIRKTSWLMLFKEIIAVYSENPLIQYTALQIV
jgi:hypothetical protein